jgi:hypothetical protein
MSTEISTQRAGGLALQTFDDAFRFAKMVAASDFAPKDFKGKPEACLLAMDYGSSIGLSRMQSLQSIAVINGRPSIWGDAALAVAMASPVCDYVTENVDGEGEQMVGVCVAKRRGYDKATVSRFSVADAKKAGLWGKTGPWTQYPKRMLQLRARGFALRDAFPDVLKGLITAEEAQDYPTPAPDPEPAREPTVVRLKPDAQPAVTDDPAAAARLAINRATSLEQLDSIRRRIEQRAGEGVFTAAIHGELVRLANGKAELLIGEEEKGQEFPHEAAEHEVTA